MKIGIVHFMAFPEVLKGEIAAFEYLLESVTKIARDDFFEVIEISWPGPQLSQAGIKAINNILEASGVTIGFGAQPALLRGKYNLNSLDHESRLGAVKVVKERIDLALNLGAKSLAVLSGSDPGQSLRYEAKKRLVESLKEICSYANGRLRIVLETFDREIDKKCLIGPAEEAAEIAEKVRWDFSDFGIMYDLSHVPLIGEDPQKSLDILKDYLVHVHIGNCVKKPGHPLFGDQHPPFGVESGEINVKELKLFLSHLLRINYLNRIKRPPVSFEVKPLPGQDPEAVIANSKRILMKAWRML